MNNLYTYTIDLRDRLTSALERAGGSIVKTNKGVQRLQRDINKIQRMPTDGITRWGNTTNRTFTQAGIATNSIIRKNRSLEQSYKQVVPQIRKVGAAIDNVNRKSRRMSGSKSGGGLMGFGGGSIKSILGGMGLAMGLQAAVSASTGFVSDSISKSLERQTIQTSFNVLSGSEEKGGALTKQLVGLSTTVGSGVYKNAQTMMGYGVDSADVAANIKMLGDVSMGNADKMESLTLAFSQVRATGKLTGTDLLQLVNAGFNPLEEMSRTTGKSMLTLKDSMVKSNISFTDVENAFKSATSEGGRFENMLAILAATPAGKVKQLSAQWDEFKISAGGAFMPLVSMALSFASKMMPMIEGLINPLTAGVQKLVDWINRAKSETGGWADYFTIIKDLVVDHYLPYMRELWGLIADIVVKFAAFAETSTAMKGIFAFFAGLYAFIFDMLKKTITGISWLFDNVVLPIMNFFEKVHRFIHGIKGEAPVQIGITPPDLTPDPKTPNLGLSAGKSGTGTAGASTAKAIATGGSKTTHITIHLGSLVQTMSVNAATVKEGAEKVRDIVLDELSRALTMAQANT